jgi:ubiquinone/menaquinone biosynthesis C-methylase UbiE
MNHLKQTKLENPVRIAELDPAGTLRRIGIGDHDTLCDIGAGSGIFTIPAAQMTDGDVHALEIDDEMLEVIREKAKKEGLKNILAAKVKDGIFPIRDGIVDAAVLVTVLHEIEDKPAFLSEIKRVLKADGRIAIIEFHKMETPMGPPVSHRLGREETAKAMTDAEFLSDIEFDLGENMYCMVFRKIR